MRFGRTLRVLRTTAGLSVRSLARQSELSPAYLSQVERGRMRPPSEGRIRALADVLDVSPGILLDLARRASADVISIVNENSEAAEFLRTAKRCGLQPGDYARLTSILSRDGVEGFRKLIGASEDHVDSEAPRDPYRLGALLQTGRVHAGISCQDLEEVFTEISKMVCGVSGDKEDAESGAPPPIEGLAPETVCEALKQREKAGTTNLGNGVAVPHATLPELTETIMCVGTLENEISFGSTEGQGVRLFFAILGPPDQRHRHMQALARIAQICLRPKTPEELVRSRSARELYETLRVLDDGLPVIAPEARSTEPSSQEEVSVETPAVEETEVC